MTEAIDSGIDHYVVKSAVEDIVQPANGLRSVVMQLRIFGTSCARVSKISRR